MNKKLQVFVSSTYTDLIEERQGAVQAILDAGHIPAGMELFKGGKSQMKTIHKWIDDSDVYMLILGGRYGSIEKDSGLSYTELEYRYAMSKNMPVFAIILDDSFLFTKAALKGKDDVFEKDNLDKYEAFKKYVKTNVVKFANNIDQISSMIYSHLNDILNNSDYNLVGWVRSDTHINFTKKDTYTYELLNKLLGYLKELALSLNNLLTNLFSGSQEYIFNSDWENFSIHYKDLYIFYWTNQSSITYCNNELNCIFSTWDDLVSIISYIKNNQDGIPNSKDNKTIETLFNTMHRALIKSIQICESTNINLF